MATTLPETITGVYLNPGNPPMVLIAVGEARSMVSTTAPPAASRILILPAAPSVGGVENVIRSGVSGHTPTAPAAGNRPTMVTARPGSPAVVVLPRRARKPHARAMKHPVLMSDIYLAFEFARVLPSVLPSVLPPRRDSALPVGVCRPGASTSPRSGYARCERTACTTNL